MIFFHINSTSVIRTVKQRWNGTFWCFWATGVTDLSVANFTQFTSFILLIPWKILSYLFSISDTKLVSLVLFELTFFLYAIEFKILRMCKLFAESIPKRLFVSATNNIKYSIIDSIMKYKIQVETTFNW